MSDTKTPENIPPDGKPEKKFYWVFFGGGVPASLSRLFWLINPNRVGIENGKSFCNSPSSVEDGSDYSNPSWPLVLPSRAGIKIKIAGKTLFSLGIDTSESLVLSFRSILGQRDCTVRESV